MKILHVYPALNCGGTEMVFYNIIRHYPVKADSFDILTTRVGERDKDFEALGCHIHRVPFVNARQYRKALSEFFANNIYDCVHTHTHSDMGLVLEAAHAAGVQLRIAHSHTARPDLPLVLRMIHALRTISIQRHANCFAACSDQAAKWLFPFRYKQAHIVRNGINIRDFAFSNEVRAEARNELGLSPQTCVILNIGRLTPPKKQYFIIDIAAADTAPNNLYIIVGEGPLMDNLQTRINTARVTDKVRLLGKRTDVQRLYNAADVFLFPSAYEGLGIVAVEAQASGIPVIASAGVPLTADVGTGLFTRLRDTNPTKWVKALANAAITLQKRPALSEMALNSPYEITRSAMAMAKIYHGQV